MIRRIGVNTTGVPQKILSGKRISIPDTVLKDWNLQTGDYVIVKQEGKRLTVSPARFIEA